MNNFVFESFLFIIIVLSSRPDWRLFKKTCFRLVCTNRKWQMVVWAVVSTDLLSLKSISWGGWHAFCGGGSSLYVNGNDVGSLGRHSRCLTMVGFVQYVGLCGFPEAARCGNVQNFTPTRQAVGHSGRLRACLSQVSMGVSHAFRLYFKTSLYLLCWPPRERWPPTSAP